MQIQQATARLLPETMRPRILVVDDETMICDLLCIILNDGSEQVAKRADEIGVPMVWMTGDHTATDASSHPILLKPLHVDRVLEVLIEARNSVIGSIDPLERPDRCRGLFARRHTELTNASCADAAGSP
jgi:hypothetical protein